MYLGIPNPNILIPLEKMTIQPQGKSSFEVLYNPESYSQSRQVQYAQAQGISTNTPVSQFAGGSLEILSFRLFFDSMSAGSEVGGGLVDRLKFAGNSKMCIRDSSFSVRTYSLYSRRAVCLNLEAISTAVLPEPPTLTFLAEPLMNFWFSSRPQISTSPTCP